LVKNDITCIGRTICDVFLINVFVVKRDISNEKFILQEKEVESLHWLTIPEIENLHKDGNLRATTWASLNLIREYFKL